MLPNFAVLPPEVNSGLLFAGIGSSPLQAAASAWDGLASELHTAAISFDSVTTGLAGESWQGPASLAMTDAATSYVTWLSTTAAQAEGAADLARAAAAEFETALAATVHPTVVAANRFEVVSLVASNFFGQNAPAIAAIEAVYEQMWAQDVSAMVGYHAGTAAVITQLSTWEQPSPTVFGALATGGSTALVGVAVSEASVAVNPITTQTVSLVLGGSGIPIPSSGYLSVVDQLYIQRSVPGAFPQALFTPQGLSPLTGLKSLPFDTSVAQGVTILDSAIRQQIAAGNNVNVFGYSQGATIASVEMAKLAASANPPTPAQLSFTLIGDPGNPNGGIAARFPGLSFPSLGVTSTGATPDNLYPTRIYTFEYDGVADAPRYPLNILANLNAIAGAYYTHTQYFWVTPEQLDAAIPLTGTSGPTMTEYYIIPSKNLPLLEPLRALPILGDPLANLVQPNLRVIVNLGYGDPAYGYSTSPPNVPTPFGLFPDVSPITVVNALTAGTQQGFADFGRDMSVLGSQLVLPSPTDLSNMLTPYQSGPATSTGTSNGVSVPAISVDSTIDQLQRTNTRFFNTLTTVAATGYATLLPTADLVNAVLTTAPSYNINLFLEGVRQAASGDPMGLANAIAYPIAADAGMLTVVAALELFVMVSAAQDIGASITALVS